MINMSTEEGQIADRQLGEASQAMEDDGPVIEITEEQKFVDDGELFGDCGFQHLVHCISLLNTLLV